MSSCERPSKSSASVFVPSSVSNRYSFSTGTQGSSLRFFASSSFRRVSSFSSASSSSRAACHSSRVPTLKLVITLLLGSCVVEMRLGSWPWRHPGGENGTADPFREGCCLIRDDRDGTRRYEELVPGRRAGAGRAAATSTAAGRSALPRSVRVLVLAPGAGLLGLRLRRSLEQERVVRRNERIGCRHRVGVVDTPVFAREGDEARVLAQAVLELGSDLPPPVLEPRGRVDDQLPDLGALLRLVGREGKPEVEGKLRPIGRDVGELPTHPLLVFDEPIDRRAREADQRHVAVVEMHAGGVEFIPQVRAPGAGAELVIGPEHDVVGEELRAPVEELGEGLLPVLAVEPVLLLHRNPGKLTSLLGHPLAELGVLGLELRKFIASRLPFLAGSDLVLGHRAPPLAVRHVSVGGSWIVGGRLSRLVRLEDRRVAPNSSLRHAVESLPRRHLVSPSGECERLPVTGLYALLWTIVGRVADEPSCLRIAEAKRGRA